MVLLLSIGFKPSRKKSCFVFSNIFQEYKHYIRKYNLLKVKFHYHFGIIHRWFHKLQYSEIQIFQQFSVDCVWEQAVEILSVVEADDVPLGPSWGGHGQLCCVQEQPHQALTLRREGRAATAIHILNVTERLLEEPLSLRVENPTRAWYLRARVQIWIRYISMSFNLGKRSSLTQVSPKNLTVALRRESSKGVFLDKGGFYCRRKPGTGSGCPELAVGLLCSRGWGQPAVPTEMKTCLCGDSVILRGLSQIRKSPRRGDGGVTVPTQFSCIFTKHSLPKVLLGTKRDRQNLNSKECCSISFI